jgi:AsmA family protein
MVTLDNTAPSTTRTAAALKWSAILVAGFVVVLLICLAVLDANADALRGPIARLAGARLGRAVRIDGPLELHLFSWTPRVVVTGLRIANPDWVSVRASEGHAAVTRQADTLATGKHPARAPGEPTDMVRVGRLQASLSIPALFKGEVLLPYVGIDDSDIDLVRDAKQRANWDFTAGGPSQSSTRPLKLPLLGSLHLGAGHLVVADEIRKLHFVGAVSADQAPNGGAQSLSLKGDGSINGAPFELTASGDPLITAESHKPYTVASDIRAGRTKVKSRITLMKPFDMGSVVADLSASGDDLADLYYLSGLALPNSAPYTVSGHLQRKGSLLKLTDFKGTLGNSDIHGTLSIETSTERPLLSAALATRLLDIKDLGPTLGSRVKTAPSSLSRQQAREENPIESTAQARAATANAAQTAAAQSPAGGAAKNGAAASPNAGNTFGLHGAKPKTADTRTAEAVAADAQAAKGATLLPDAKLDLKRIRGMDANVKYRADAVKTDKMSIRAIAFAMKLDKGVMTFAPLSFTLPQGKLVSNITLDGAKDVPEVSIDSRITAVQLSQFKTKDGQEPLDGTMVGRAIIRGRGKSLHEVGSTAEGTLTVVVPHGDIRAAFAELMGINAANGLGLLLTKNQEKTGIRCGVANFKGQGGVFAVQDLVIDTDKVLITGKGEVDLGPEVLDLTLNGQPKKVRFFRIKSPIEVGGTLSKPKVGLKPGNTPGQIALATALGVLATPLASVLAFIDPGLAKDADCGALLAEAQRQGAPPPKDQQTNDQPKDAPIKDAQRSTKARSIT